MTSRKPLDPIPSPDPITVRYCWLCHFDARWCEHDGNKHVIGEIGGGSPNYQYARFKLGSRRGVDCRWEGNGDYLLTPMAAMERVLSSSMSTIEWIEGDPMEVDKGIAWFAERTQVLAYMEEKWLEDENAYIGIPRHAMSRYAMQKWGDGEQFRKVQVTLDDRPCFCANPLCTDIERSQRWLEDYGTDADYEHDAISRVLWTLHPMWNPSSTRLSTIQFQLATHDEIYEDEKRKQKMREAA